MYSTFTAPTAAKAAVRDATHSVAVQGMRSSANRRRPTPPLLLLLEGDTAAAAAAAASATAAAAVAETTAACNATAGSPPAAASTAGVSTGVLNAVAALLPSHALQSNPSCAPPTPVSHTFAVKSAAFPTAANAAAGLAQPARELPCASSASMQGWHFTPRYFAFKTPIDDTQYGPDDTQYGPCDTQYGPCDQSDTGE
jgi:hypothetical protein